MFAKEHTKPTTHAHNVVLFPGMSSGSSENANSGTKRSPGAWFFLPQPLKSAGKHWPKVKNQHRKSMAKALTKPQTASELAAKNGLTKKPAVEIYRGRGAENIW